MIPAQLLTAQAPKAAHVVYLDESGDVTEPSIRGKNVQKAPTGGVEQRDQK
jgi:hypothetical protein